MTTSTILPSSPIRRTVTASGLLQRFAVPICWIVLIIVFGALRPEAFLTISTLSSILGSAAPLVVLALAVVVTIRGGDYDLSVAAVMTLSGVIIGVLNIRMQLPIGIAILVAFAAAVIIGLVNAFFCVVLGVDSFIVTLGMATILGGVTLWVSNSTSYSGLDPWLVSVITSRAILGIPAGFFVALAVTLVMWVVFEYTAVGRQHLFVGKSRDVARLNGMPVGRTRTVSFVTGSLLAAFASVLYVGGSGGVDPTSGLSLLLPAFAAAFLGSTTIVPGQFNPWGAFISVYFIVTGITGLAIMGLPTFVQSLFYGGALVVAVALANIVKRGIGRRPAALIEARSDRPAR